MSEPIDYTDQYGFPGVPEIMVLTDEEADDVHAHWGKEHMVDGCQSKDPKKNWWVCSRRRGHRGDHIAYTGPEPEWRTVTARWPQDSKPQSTSQWAWGRLTG